VKYVVNSFFFIGFLQTLRSTISWRVNGSVFNLCSRMFDISASSGVDCR